MSGSADTSKPVETYGRGLYVGVLVFVSLLSVAGNAVYAYAAPAVSEASLSPGWAAAAHMIPPVTLLLVTEVLAMASAKFAGRGRAWALAGVVVIAVAAFALSFDALYEVALMAKVRAELAWLVPVMLDVAIIVCTTLVLMASRQMQRDRAEAATAVVVDRPRVGDSTRGDVAITHSTNLPPVDDHPVVVADYAQSPQVSEVVAGYAAATPAVGHQPVDQPATAPVAVAESATDPAPATGWLLGDSPAEGVGDSATTPAPATPADHPPVADQAVVDSPTTATDLLEAVAEAVHAATSTTKPLRAVVDVLRLADEGESQRAIAAEVGVDRSLVRKWTMAAEEYGWVRRPALAAVD